MKKRIISFVLSFALSAPLFTGLVPGTGPVSVSAAEMPVIEYFKEPDANSKPMARMWFPDAAAGEDDEDFIEKQIFELAEKGFGGVEVAMLADGVSYNNAEGKQYGWGTENWSKLLKKVLTAASKVLGGFQVDMTITAHWPPTLNTLDPNDDAANKELSYSFTKITAEDLANGTIDLVLPEQKINGPAGGFGGVAYEHFLFTDTFVSAAIVKVSEIKEIPGSPGAPPFTPATPDTTRYVFDYGTLIPITDSIDIVPDSGYAAGVPDKETADAYGWDYDGICEFFGPESDGPWTMNNGKQDADLNRKRMADWQDEYAADINGLDLKELSDESEIEAGDWVIISTFFRGTGQSIPGGRIMHNGVFVTNYFNDEGTKAVTDYWDAMLANDPELLKLMRANKGYIFEDSIEASSVSSYWAPGLMDDIADTYVYKDILPIIAASKYLSSGFMGTSLNVFYEFDGDDGLIDRIYEDYNDKMAELYIKYRVTGVSNWTDHKLGWGFRGQTYHLPGLEISRAAMVADVPEGDNMAKGDGIRYQAGTVNITGKDYLTMEAITGPTIGYASLDDIKTEVAQNFSDGVNRVILHGTPYAKTFNEYNSDWPGWLPFGPGSFGSAYTYRQAYWDGISAETGYMARTQAVLQKGEAQIDLAVMIDKESTYDFEGGNRFQNLLDLGYSYNLISEATLNDPNAIVTDGRLAANGPAYKALIIDRVSMLSLEGINKLIQYVEAGLPIVIYNSNIECVYGSNVNDDAIVANLFGTLKEMSNVEIAESLDEVYAALDILNISPYAIYNTPQLETTLYKDMSDNTNYYYMFNNAFPENSGMMGNTQGSFYKGEDKVIHNAEVTLSGSGVPYKLDALTGEITQVGEYTINDDDTVTFEIDELYGGDSMIYAITSNEFDFPACDAFVKNVDKSSDTYSIVRTDSALALRSNTPATYAITTSDDNTINLTVDERLDALDLSKEQWDLVIKSYSPDSNSSDPSISNKITVDFGKQSLGKWKDIPATETQLSELGVNDMRYVSGIGEYTITFDAPSDWNENTGAYLDVSYGKDQIGSYTINGVTIMANNASDRVDLAGLLVLGNNTITISLATTLYGRMYVENSGYADREFGMGGGFMSPVDPEAYFNGLLNVTLTPYTQIELAE